MAECSSGAKKYLRCFCNCSDLTVEDVKKIYRLSAQETLINRQACTLFEKFLKKNQSGDESETQQFLKIYQKCDDYINNIQDKLITEKEVEELSDLGLERWQEVELEKEVRTGDSYKIEMCLRRIQGRSRNKIESSYEYTSFKDAILKKLRNANV